MPSENLSGSLKPRADKPSLSETRPRYRLTKLGEQMARLPIDPKIARMLIAAKKHDCVQEMLVIVSALSIQDPRERPLEAREAAAKAHERFADKQSDFLAYLNIWDSFQRERDKGLSNKQLVQWCHQYFLSHLRMREWRELHRQLAEIAIEMGLADKENAFRRPPEQAQLRPSESQGDQDLSAKLKQKQLDKKQHRANVRAAKEAGYEQIHRALLTGLIANVGMKSPDGHDYTGARGSHFHLFPASALFKSKPKWVMAAELTETTRLYARDVAEIKPEWIEQEAPHLVRYHYFEPHWEQKRGEVVAGERVTLYGLTVLPRRPVAYGKVAPEEARELFIRGALVAQECDLKADFFVHNKKLIQEISELEHKSRRQDVLVDDEILFEFYNQRLPEMFVPSETVGRALMPDTNGAAQTPSGMNARPTTLQIRPAETDDAAAVAELFRRAVMHIPDSFYSGQEKNAWLQGADNADFWRKRIERANIRVAVRNGRVAGFVEYLPEQAYIDCLYTDPHHQRQGIASALLSAVLPADGKTVTADVSKAAADFFKKHGFMLQHENKIPRNGLVLNNYRMVWPGNAAGSLPSENTECLSENPRRTGVNPPWQNTAETVGLHPPCGTAQTVGRALMPDGTTEKTPSGINARPTPSEKPLPLADIRTFQAWLKTAEQE
ncbi:GNAT family N-acetyltransferase, partial [Neisseria sp.]|uniref:GNAT family N-acetyltransferase n=1 Tax=Neisseria sp. TaxID=192066 RepID=UPI0026DC0CBF